MGSEPVVRRTGVVRSVARERALVALDAQGCAACGKQGACAAGKLAAGRGATLIEVPAEGLRAGETVVCEIPERELLAAALKGYLLPAALLLLGAGLGEASGDAAAALGALAGLILGMAANRRAGRRFGELVVRRG
jgi:positive regulator of sigma E activity